MKDEGLRELQLNGKQLVFAFMVATVLAVVVFLLGVLVGRGLRPASRIDLATASTASTVDPTLPEPSSSATAQSDQLPVSARESLDYTERLESPTPLPDDIREPEPGRPAAAPSTPAPVPPPPVTAKPPAATAAPAIAKPPAPETAKPDSVAARPDPALAEPAGPGYVVQVMAVNTRAEAETVAKRLAGKGYKAFVTTTGTGAQVTYRVRVGKFATRQEADAVSARLQKEEQFKPWIAK